MSKTGGDMERAKALIGRGDFAGAETLARAALAANPFDAEATAVLGVAADGRGDKPKALELLKNAIAMDGKQAEFHNNLAIVLKSMGRLDEARAAYETAMALDPDSGLAAYNLAILLRADGRLEEALSLSRQAAAADPADARRHNNLGTLLQETGRYEEAADAFRRAIAADPGYANAYGNLAASLAEADRPEEALTVTAEAARRWPGNAEIRNAECNAFTRLNRLDDAIAAADRTLAVDPDHANAHYARGMLRMIQDDFAGGWPDYEWRVRRAGFWPKRRYSQPRWQGEPLAGKTLLVHWEQGFGDVIQFSRFLLPLEARHPEARILFDCPAKLIELLGPVSDADEVGDFGDSPPDFDYFVPLMSLPLMLGVSIEALPPQPPLAPPPGETAVVPELGRPKVGITWASDHGADYRRKVCALDHWAPLFEDDRIAFYGMQFGREGAELDPWEDRDNVANLGESLGGFAHTAAVAAEMDLILSIDTYMVHLAGAMDQPAWVMLPFSPDWRWRLEGDASPWYPSLRLFRQPAPGDWDSVIAQVAAALDEWVATRD